MYYSKLRKGSVFLVVLVMFFLVILPGCELLGLTEEENIESWTHVIVAENYTDFGTYGVYRIEDSRFNENDWYEMWMDNSYWDPASGWGSFDSVYDSVAMRMYFQPLYNDGYVEWNTYTATDLLADGTHPEAATLRFYRQE